LLDDGFGIHSKFCLLPEIDVSADDDTSVLREDGIGCGAFAVPDHPTRQARHV
jgi:hypothetical protein